jgi:hypothetical protein
LLINIFLRDVASRDQRVNALLGRVVSVLAETNVEKLAVDPILVAKLIVLPRACVLHSLGDCDRLRARLASEAQNKDGGDKQTTPSRVPLLVAI